MVVFPPGTDRRPTKAGQTAKESNRIMSETQTQVPSKKETIYEAVTMEDGTTVQFPGTRKVQKSVILNEAAGVVSVRFDFRNGAVRVVSSRDLTRELELRAMGHGLSQKIGDEWSGTTEVDDMTLECDAMIERLKAGDWGVTREAGDSMKGASVVIRAICEVSGKDVGAVKAFLDGKLEAAKAKGEKLSRQELYQSFRNPASETGKVIKRLEEEKITKASKFSASDLLGELAQA